MSRSVLHNQGVVQLCVTDDGVRVYARVAPDGKTEVWGQHDLEGRVEIERLSLSRRIDFDLPLGEYPADLVTYVRA